MHASVIMINRNGGGYLAGALRSCRADLEQTWRARRDFELLVVDNGSTDASLTTIATELSGAAFPWRVIEEPTPGVNSARNSGLREAQGDLLVFVDSDVHIHPGWLAAYLDAAERYPEAALFAGRVRVGTVEGDIPAWLDIDGPWKRACIVVQVDYGAEPALWPLNRERGPVGPNMAFRRATFRRVGGFDTRFGLRPGSLVAGAEAEFFERLGRQGVRFAWVPEAVVDHPLKRGQISRRYFLDRLHGIGRVASRIDALRGETPRRVCGLTLYRLPELARALALWLGEMLGHDARRAFFYRGQVAILAGYLHEDWRRWWDGRGGSRPELATGETYER